jgi:3-deoxy-7-phosphoheptulonate synthase
MIDSPETLARPSTAKPSRYPLAARAAGGRGTIVSFGRGGNPVLVGGRDLVVIAGPCSVEGREMLLETAAAVRDAGGSALRGGAFKPRTSPYDFQGLGAEGLELLAEARAASGLPIVTEVVDPRQVEHVARYADVLQVGTRNMHNTPLLAEVGRSGKPVLLKRGFAAKIEEFLFAAEYVMNAGNRDVILCERGIRTFETATRNTLDVAAIPLLKAETHLPVIVDPSHAGGRRSLVTPLSLAAIAAGADGLIVEVHPDPAHALSDGEQSIAFDALASLLRALRPIAHAAGRRLVPPPLGVPREVGDEAALRVLRDRITETDLAIVDLAAERSALARRARDAKIALGFPIVDPAREREVERLILERARDRGLPDAHIETIAHALIALARAAQDVEEYDS